MSLVRFIVPESLDLLLAATTLLLLVTAWILTRRLENASRHRDALEERVEALEEASDAPLAAVRKRRDEELVSVLEGLLEYSESLRRAETSGTSKTDGGSP